MRIELSLKPEISIRQALCIEYPVVIEDIKEYFKDNESGDVRNLKELLRVVPQRQHGRLAYVVGGGWAVEVLTGKARDHGNINVLVVDPNRTSLESNRCLDYLGVHYLENALQRALIKK
ncbi:hypothetical protein KY309_02885, partial [Candidatus Woesearchaeota archaeon]|nr:hypothetical protein [Candidatus Woesearchaeota archaeon]